jgi:hypothetical protein
MFADAKLPSFLLSAAFVIGMALDPFAFRHTSLSLLDSSRQANSISPDVPATCRVTRPPQQAFTPPPPYPSAHGSDGFWFGTSRLWLQLPTNGTWGNLPHYRPSDTAFRQKLQWWRKGYNWRTDMPTKLKVTGKRLDSNAPPLASQTNASGRGDQAFLMSGLDIPTLGCWQITGDFAGDKLTFVVWVAP